MRIWSLHPKYLDTKGLVALWRETILAKHVLEGKTIGYIKHPQLMRFKNSKIPLNTINNYLAIVYQEAMDRQYNFDRQKVNWSFTPVNLPVTTGQLNYEASHLLKKLKLRDSKRYKDLKNLVLFEPHPLFSPVAGTIENWENPKV